MIEREILLYDVSEDELNSVLLGENVVPGLPWYSGRSTRSVSIGRFGVLAETLDRYDSIRPTCIVLNSEDARRLYGRFGTLRGDLSPITTWCHAFPPRMFESLDGPVRNADLLGLESAWIGLIVAEASVLANRPVGKLTLAACTATQSFAIARTFALWPFIKSSAILDKFDAVQRLLRTSPPKMDQIRAKLSLIWIVLSSVSGVNDAGDLAVSTLARLVERLKERRLAGEADGNEVFSALRKHIPEIDVLDGIEDVKPEDRVARFDFLVSILAAEPSGTNKSELICFAAGYLATIAAGGTPSIGLAERISERFPQVLLWAYVIGSLGQRIVWNSAFDGLGRFINRELSQSFSIQEYPSYDILADEAEVLVDRKLADPLVRLRLKQQRVATVGLFPGVAISVPLEEVVSAARADPPVSRVEVRRPTQGRDLSDLADQIWPLIRGRLLAELGSEESELAKVKTRGKKREASQAGLPFKK